MEFGISECNREARYGAVEEQIEQKRIVLVIQSVGDRIEAGEQKRCIKQGTNHEKRRISAVPILL